MGPLAGVRVLTIENFISAPIATMWLADAGADVVKVEIPGAGDTSRSVQPIRERDGERRSLSFIRANRNKRSIELDLKDPAGREQFQALLAKADVLVENLRPTALKALGLTYDDVRRINPKIIYGAISGFGLPEFNEGDLPFWPAFDVVAQAMGGLLFRPEGAQDTPVYAGFPLADIFASANLQSSIYQALYHRERTGEGACIDISMLDGVVAFNELALIMYGALNEVAARGMHGLSAPFGSYPTANGHIVIAVLGEPVWRRFTDAMGRPDIANLPEFGSGRLRHQNREVLDAHITNWLGRKSTDEVLQQLRAYDVPASPVLDINEVIELENLRKRGMVTTVDDPVWGSVRMAGNPLHSSLMEKMPLVPAPELGADTETVLRDWLADPAD
ncbi:formyl-CoA transferase [Cryptosporangium aurantiacum]|uniref:Formyl-CoA transferase n=2 Tax=Cryptosporangium aurantiacum TaxID=134849 RepID=A0A1M7R3K7_9ACTN|nr:formyl-CoA transferase [Cryptosporangium aurantiacum]